MPSRDEILAAYAAGPEALVTWVEQLVGAHEREVAKLTARLEQLEGRLNKESHNSHKPPSSDGPAKRPRPHRLRQRSGKKSGGQPGHPGVTRCLVDDPDSIVRHVPTTCVRCSADLEAVSEVAPERRQVIEIPEPRPLVIEHQAVQKTCPVCRTVTAGEFPPEVTQAVAVYLQTYQLLPYERTIEALKDLFGVSPSEGILTSAQSTAYTCLEPVEQAIGAALRQETVVHVDETSQRVAGRTEWVHAIGIALLTFYAHHAKRGRAAIEAIDLLIGFAGRRVHDAWTSYLSLAGAYALCNAHLLRELIGLYEGIGQAWAQKLIQLLLNMKAAVETARAAGQTELPARQRAGFEAAYTRFLNEGLLANPPHKRRASADAPNRHPPATCSSSW